MNIWSLGLAAWLLIAANGRATAFFTSSSGNASLKGETEESVANKIKKGKTTQKEVKSLFGSPISSYFTDSGLEVWTYHFSKQKDNAMNYVPYVSLVQSGSKGVAKELKIIFTEK